MGAGSNQPLFYIGLLTVLKCQIIEAEARRDIAENVPQFLAVWLSTTNNSAKRSYSKALCLAIRQGLKLDDATTGRIAERALDLLISPATPIASQAWALYILQELAGRVGWIDGVLPEVVLQISQSAECSPGMAVATRRYLRGK